MMSLFKRILYWLGIKQEPKAEIFTESNVTVSGTVLTESPKVRTVYPDEFKETWLEREIKKEPQKIKTLTQDEVEALKNKYVGTTSEDNILNDKGEIIGRKMTSDEIEAFKKRYHNSTESQIALDTFVNSQAEPVEKVITVSPEAMNKLVNVIENPPAPNEALTKAIKKQNNKTEKERKEGKKGKEEKKERKEQAELATKETSVKSKKKYYYKKKKSNEQ